MNTELKIRKKSLPDRCEICHQADYFNPQTNHCSRCANITAPIPSPPERRTEEITIRRNSPYYYFGLIIGALFSLLFIAPVSILNIIMNYLRGKTNSSVTGGIIGGITGFILGFLFGLLIAGTSLGLDK